MTDDFPQSYNDLFEKLKFDGKISVEFIEKNKKGLKLGFDRINKLETILMGRKSIFRPIKYYAYSAYVGVVNVVLSPKDQGFDRALLIYTVAWRHIANYDGMSLPNGMARITFNART